MEEALAGRRSTRTFATGAVTRVEVGQLLWAAQGVTSARGYRTAPSAGGLYPLEVYVATREGVFRYVPREHRLAPVATGDRRAALYRASLSQDAVRRAPIVFVIAAEVARTQRKYRDRARRYVHIEAGHAAQNLLLQATTLGLAGVPIGAFSDGEVRHALGCAASHEPLLVIPIGRPH